MVFLQERCAKHRYIRSKDTSTIVERPERLRAIHLGLAAAVARVELSRGIDVDAADSPPRILQPSTDGTTDVLADALARMGIADGAGLKTPPTTTALLPDPLIASLGMLTLDTPGSITTPSSVPGSSNGAVELVRSNALVDLCSHPAVDFIHGDEDPKDNPLLKLRDAVKHCANNIKDRKSEVPLHLNQEDLYCASLFHQSVIG